MGKKFEMDNYQIVKTGFVVFPNFLTIIAKQMLNLSPFLIVIILYLRIKHFY